jgi:transketolase
MALALRARGNTSSRVICLVGDAELDEGSNHEAIAVAGRLGLESLIVVAVDNRSSSLGWPGGIHRRFEVEGWTAATVDGRDHAAIETAFATPHPNQPLAVVATVEMKS